jgi:hypothetical protein
VNSTIPADCATYTPDGLWGLDGTKDVWDNETDIAVINGACCVSGLTAQFSQHFQSLMKLYDRLGALLAVRYTTFGVPHYMLPACLLACMLCKAQKLLHI